MTITPPSPSGRRSDARTARRVLLVVAVVALVLAVIVPAGRYAWRFVDEILHVNDDRAAVDTGNLTAWQDRAQASQILRDTAAATGLDVQLWDPGIGEEWCQRVDGKNGTLYSLDDLEHEGPVDPQAVIAAAVAYWQRLGLKVDAPRTFGPTSTAPVTKVWAMTPTGAWIGVGVGTVPPDVTLFTGESGCGEVGGGPTPLPSPTLLPVSSGVPVPRSSTP